jgi:hypothetical protein
MKQLCWHSQFRSSRGDPLHNAARILDTVPSLSHVD